MICAQDHLLSMSNQLPIETTLYEVDKAAAGGDKGKMVKMLRRLETIRGLEARIKIVRVKR
jgi:hypothetical protein